MSINKIIVAKFGGTSMIDVAAMTRSAHIVLKRNINLVVLSAISGTTDQLSKICKLAVHGKEEDLILPLKEIEEKHFHISRSIDAGESTVKHLKSLMKELETLVKSISLLRECSLRTKDALLSIGERFSSLLFTDLIGKLSREKKISLIDARTIIRTDSDFSKATPDLSLIKKLCDQHLDGCKKEREIVVTQGFIGMSKDGITTTIGRGGSDFSAALLAEGINADVLEIWTDVAGVATTDPRICEGARSLSKISFEEAQELATFGAKVLHPETLAPAIRSNFSVYVASSYHPERDGTWIVHIEDRKNSPLVRALAFKSNQTLVTLTNPKMLHSYGFLKNIFLIFHKHKVSVDLITTSKISMALTLDDSTLLNTILIDELGMFAELDIERDLSLISLIGNHINYTPRLAEKIFTSVGDINVRMICLGASKHNFCFLVKQEEGIQAIKSLHKDFIEKVETCV